LGKAFLSKLNSLFSEQNFNPNFSLSLLRFLGSRSIKKLICLVFRHIEGVFKMKKALIGLSITVAASCSVYLSAYGCEPHWISGISDCGQLIQLENHQSWQVHQMDIQEVLKWKLGEHVDICDGGTKMKNMDRRIEDQRWIKVKQLSWGKRSKNTNSCEVNPL
jgi:hypothetical protein